MRTGRQTKTIWNQTSCVWCSRRVVSTLVRWAQMRLAGKLRHTHHHVRQVPLIYHSMHEGTQFVRNTIAYRQPMEFNQGSCDMVSWSETDNEVDKRTSMHSDPMASVVVNVHMQSQCRRPNRDHGKFCILTFSSWNVQSVIRSQVSVNIPNLVMTSSGASPAPISTWNITLLWLSPFLSCWFRLLTVWIMKFWMFTKRYDFRNYTSVFTTLKQCKYGDSTFENNLGFRPWSQN